MAKIYGYGDVHWVNINMAIVPNELLVHDIDEHVAVESEEKIRGIHVARERESWTSINPTLLDTCIISIGCE